MFPTNIAFIEIRYNSWLRFRLHDLHESLRERQQTKTQKPRNCLRGLHSPDFMRNILIIDGAEGGIRTPTLLRASAPQAGASASSATSAFLCTKAWQGSDLKRY